MLLMTAASLAFYAVVRVSSRVKKNADVLAPVVVSSAFVEEEMGRWFPTTSQACAITLNHCNYLYRTFY